ncbi:DUF317 domain-containing protein [Streptomyces niveus]|uniref:DUF317 domain-containing protein n=1 Tax=Streptomyces niveus TaxID=193462 RepID=UPI00365E30D7
MTDTERDTADARTSPSTPTTEPEPPHTGAGTAPAGTPGPGAHEALFASFIEDHGEWEKYRTWSDDASVANHESLTLRAEFDHEARDRDIAWTIASYQSPVGERTWHATAGTPTDIIETLLKSLDTDTAWTERTGAPLTEPTLTAITRPLTEFGWTQTISGHHINWPAPNGETGLRLDVAAAVGATTAHSRPAWTLWGGKRAEQPTWTIDFSRQTPAAVLQDLTYNLALTHSARTAHPQKVPGHGHKGVRTTAPATPTPPAPGRAARSS